MAMTQDRATDRDPGTMSVTEIDREVASLTTALDTVTDVATATAYERRREALVRARGLAAVRERAHARLRQAEEAQEAREVFDRVAAEVPPLLRTQAQALDAWVREGKALRAALRETVLRFAEVQDVLVPAPVGREMHLPQLFERLLAIDQPLEECLARQGVLTHIVLPALARDPALSIERHVVWRVEKLLNDMWPRLPAAPSPDDDEDEAAGQRGGETR
jgi:hypothetical protein